MEPLQIADFLTIRAAQHPQKKAVIFPEGRDRSGRVSYTHLTFGQLSAEAHDLAQRLVHLGIQPGVGVALMVKPSLEFFVLTFALFKVGALPVFIDPGMGVRHIGRCLAQACPQVFIGIPKAQLARILFGWQRRQWQHIITVGSWWRGLTLHKLKRAIPAKPVTLPSLAKDDRAAILFTSGSTGAPKGVLYQHKHFLAQIEALSLTYGFGTDEVDLCTFPLFALFAPALAMTAVIPDMDFSKPGRVNPQRLFEALDNHAITNMFGSPALMKVFGQAMARDGQSHRLSGLRRIISAGAPVPFQTLAEVLKHLDENADIFTPYGATESLPIANMAAREILRETAALTAKGAGICVGYPVAGTVVKVISIDDGAVAAVSESNLCTPGQVGEIIVSGPQVTPGYIGDDQATSLAKIPDRHQSQGFWHRMGDLGYFDDSGRLWYCGRKSHRVRATSGDMFTIPCESIFNQHPAVERSALVGVGPEGDERPLLYVQPKQPRSTSASRATLIADLVKVAQGYESTRSIKEFRVAHSFPVDIRHNSKIFREKLKASAQRWSKRDGLR